MIGRNFIVKPMRKIFLKFLTVTEKTSKKRYDVTQLWRQWWCLLKVKIHSTLYVSSQYRS